MEVEKVGVKNVCQCVCVCTALMNNFLKYVNLCLITGWNDLFRENGLIYEENKCSN